MSIHGNLRTMNLPDLLQWAANNRKTGVFELERNMVCRTIQFRDGRIVSCSSNDTASRLGQFLVARGKISRECLKMALKVQEQTGQSLPDILVEMQAVSRDEIESQVAAKAEETIYGLFDWSDAVFRYRDGACDDPYLIEVNLSVEDVLLNGIQRYDELQRIRGAFAHSGLVLAPTDGKIPSEIAVSGMARRILQLVDGHRTLAEVLIHAQVSEFLVVKFLYMLLRRGAVYVADSGTPDGSARTLLDMTPEPEVGEALDRAQPADGGASPGSTPAHQHQFELAARLAGEGDHRQALQILEGCYRENPDDNHLRHLVLQAESRYLTQVRDERFPSSLVPTPTAGAAERAADSVATTDQFVLSMLDGRSDIKAVLWGAPMREVDVFKALERLLEQGLIEMSEVVTESPSGDRDMPVKSVEWSPF